MENKFIELGKFNLDNNVYQLLIDTNLKRHYLRVKQTSDGQEQLEEITPEEHQKLAAIFEQGRDGTIFYNSIKPKISAAIFAAIVFLKNYCGISLQKKHKYNDKNMASPPHISSQTNESLYSIDELVDSNPGIEEQYKQDAKKFLNLLRAKIPNQKLPGLKKYLKWVIIKAGEADKETEGLYSFWKNKITIKSTLLVDKIYHVLSHELLHMISNKDVDVGFLAIGRNSSFGNMLNEGMTEWLNYEINKDQLNIHEEFDLAYKMMVNFIHLLMEVVEPEKMIKNYIEKDAKSIIEDLSKISESKENAIKLIGRIDTMGSIFYDKSDLTVNDLMGLILLWESTATLYMEYWSNKKKSQIDNGVYSQDDILLLLCESIWIRQLIHDNFTLIYNECDLTKLDESTKTLRQDITDVLDFFKLAYDTHTQEIFNYFANKYNIDIHVFDEERDRLDHIEGMTTTVTKNYFDPNGSHFVITRIPYSLEKDKKKEYPDDMVEKIVIYDKKSSYSEKKAR